MVGCESESELQVALTAGRSGYLGSSAPPMSDVSEVRLKPQSVRLKVTAHTLTPVDLTHHPTSLNGKQG
jgi:hypothetical protein